MDFAATVTAEQADRSRAVAAAGRAHIRSLVSPGTIVALPTAPSIAPLVTASGEALEHFRVRTMRLTCTAGIAGLPQISLPVGTVSGCPAGLSFIGWPGGDEILLDLACELGRFCGIRMA
jgi:amidase